MNRSAPPPARRLPPPKTSGWLLLAFGAISVTLLSMWALFANNSSTTNRCPTGTTALAGRCCPEGQRQASGRCIGNASRCPAPLTLQHGQCVVPWQRRRIEAGSLQIGPGDWEAQGLVKAQTVHVRRAFWLDRWEVTVARWNGCVHDHACSGPIREAEPGLPVTKVNAEQATQVCAWAGGRLPTESEWLLAAAGPSNHRYPWGETGAVCIRACWGLRQGPCLVGGKGPDLAGLHTMDRTADGIQDLAGGVSEWVLGKNGKPMIRGGNWRSELAASLRTWFVTERARTYQGDDVGVRCAYDHATPRGARSGPPASTTSPSTSSPPARSQP